MATTPRYHFNTLGPGGSLAADGYKFGTADRLLMEALAWLGAEGHHHNGAIAVAESPVAPSLALGLPGSGTLPGGTRLWYKTTLVDPYGIESDASPEAYIDTPPTIAPPAAGTVIVEAGGTLLPGPYYYALSAYYPLQTQETTAPGVATAMVFSGGTNRIRLTFPSLPAGASGFNVYRRRPGEVDYFYVTTIAMDVATPPVNWIDDGSMDSACDRRRPSTNQTQSANSVIVSLGGATPSLPGEGWTWKVYRTLTNASWVASYLHHVVEETAENSGIIALSTVDTGGSAFASQPPTQSVLIGSPSKIDLATEVTGALPQANVAGFPATITFEFTGAVAVGNGTRVRVVEFPNFTVLGLRANLGRGSVPAATAIVADVKRWDPTMATPAWVSLSTSDATRPQIAVGTPFGVRVVPGTTALVAGDALVVDVLTAGGGATPTDTNLTVTVYGYASGFVA